jgi:hypothetical protein
MRVENGGPEAWTAVRSQFRWIARRHKWGGLEVQAASPKANTRRAHDETGAEPD